MTARFLLPRPLNHLSLRQSCFLVEEGIIRTSDLVSKYIPEFGVGTKAEIRIAHCLHFRLAGYAP